MNENTAKLLEQLANKLGTTSAYLWNVLIKQAPISSTTTLFQYLILAMVGVILWKTHLRLSKPKKDCTYSSNAYDENDGVGILMIVTSIIYIVLLSVAFFSVESVINGYFNPEYWALDQILSNVK